MAISALDLDGTTAGTGGSASFTEQTAVTLFPNATLNTSGGFNGRADQITVTIQGATATETLSVAQSVLTAAGVTASYVNGVLTLTKTNGTDADWITVLKAITYNDTSDAPPSSRTISVTATDTDSASSSTATGSISVSAVNDAPTGSVTITGDAIEGETLSAANSLGDADGLGTISYQWLRDGVAITGENGSSYTLVDADVGTVISVAASYTDGQGTPESVESAATAAVVSGLSISGTAGNDVLIGSAGNDTIDGGAGNDSLDGGAGADTMSGGIGNDTYYVDDAGDVVTELSGEGTDTVRSSITYTLTANVERLTLTGTAAIDGTGNALNNIITGNAGDNTLDGGAGNDRLFGMGGDDVLTGGTGNDGLNGGAGADTMSGGIGNDIYYVHDAGDVVIELSGEGSDVVNSIVDFTLGDNVENLLLRGNGAIDGTGNDLANRIVGNAGDNSLSGGDGNDKLTGGAGSDVFVFDTAPNASTNVDKIIDFAVGEDSIQLDQAVFSAIDLGTLSEQAFCLGTAAADTDDRIVYDSATGNIYYDADGSDPGAAVLFAQVTAGTALTNADFMIIG